MATTEPQFTAGEWSLPHFADPCCTCKCGYVLTEQYCGAVATVHVDNGKCIVDGGNDAPPLEEAIANAYLIHAAPDMYHALTAMIAALKDNDGIDAAIWQAKQALNKATPRPSNTEVRDGGLPPFSAPSCSGPI